MTTTQPGRALHRFFEWENQAWVGVVADVTTPEKAYLVPVESVRSYLAADDELSYIISDVFKSQYPPIDSDMILRDHTAIFCILLRIGHGRYIEHFARYEELSDRRLPFDPKHPPAGFPNEPPDFLRRFCENQWMYCVPIFDGHMLHKHFGRQRLLPITSKEPCGIEGMARKYVIELYGLYNRLLSTGQQSETRPNANTFVLKSYSQKDGEGPYNEEVNGFRSVRHSDSIIKFYGSYIHGDELNIVLEFADKGSLEEYFQKEAPPSRGADIINFWAALFQLVKGLKDIHSIRKVHHDISPENVVALSHGAASPSDWQFKFASFGLRNSPSGMAQGVQAHRMHSSYGAPECYLSYDVQPGEDSTSITWAADIWSLGCLYSEVAVWISDGYKGLLDYRKRREAETGRILFNGGDCFHDGERVLQTVLDAHRDVEDSLRRSDYITKDVLESMVDEMLWEEDRPNAKSLSRKAEVLLSRARQKLAMKSEGEYPRPGSSQTRSVPPPRFPPPKTPVPPIPRGLSPGLTSISERGPPNVEKWRSQVTTSRSSGSQFGGSQTSRPGSELPSPTFPKRQTISTESDSDFERELNGSIASWQMGDDSTAASSVSQSGFPHSTGNLEYMRPVPNEGRNRSVRGQISREFRRPPLSMSSGMSYVNKSESLEDKEVARPPPLHPLYTQVTPTSTNGSEWNSASPIGNQTGIDETRSIARSASRAESHNSSHYSVLEALAFEAPPEEPQVPPKSQKRSGFSLFPTKSRSSARHEDAVPRSVHHFQNDTNGIPPVPDQTPYMEYLSVNTCLEWKRAHKKVKKSTQVPPLPGAQNLELLKGRNHIFIVDDSASMKPIWPEMKRVFEALVYVTKDMSTDGTELFFTINYDTYTRKETSSLLKLLDTNETIGNIRVPAGQTDIAYRLNLQLESHCRKLHTAKYTPLPPKGKKDKTPRNIKPISLYILTNGEWGEGPDPKITIQKHVDFLVNEKYTNGQISVQFISFASSPSAMQKINDVAKHDFGLDIVGSSSAKDNVLKMLLGPLENLYASGGGSGGSVRSGLASSRSTIMSVSRSGTSVASELG